MTAGTAPPATAGHIAILIQNLEGGGAQRIMITLARSFVRLGRRVDVILAGAGRGELMGELLPAIRLFTLGGQRPGQDRREAIGDLASYLAMEKPDVLLAGAAAIHPLAVAAQATFPGVALLLCATSHPRRPIPWTRPREYLKELLVRRRRARCYARADGIIAVSEAVALAVRRMAPKVAVKVIHNPVITASFLAGATRPIELPWDSSPDIPIILSVGRVHPAKDFPTLVRAFALLRQSRPARLVIIGDGFAGRRGKEIRALIERLGIGADVAVLEPTNAIAAWLSRSDIFVSSSIWEGSPSVVIEALAMGCQVAATDCAGGSRELLHDGRIGGLAPIRNPAALARAIAAGLDHPIDPETLRAASNPYREAGRAEEYLAALDACVQTVDDRTCRK